MKRIRIRVILLACWLVVFYRAEQLFEPNNFSQFTFAFVLAMVLLTLLAPRLTRIPLWFFLAAPAVVFLIFKALTGAQLVGNALPITVTELCAIVVTTLLAHWVSSAISEFETAIAHITIGRRDKVIEPAGTGHSTLYREVRRARNHQRPLALLAIAVEEKSIKVALDRMVQEAQLSMMKQYMLSGVSRTLCDKLEDCDIVVQSNDHFLVLLPETTPEDLPHLVERLRQDVSDQVGIDLRIGTASLPKDSFTFEGLLEQATDEMREGVPSELFVDLERLSIERHIT